MFFIQFPLRNICKCVYMQSITRLKIKPLLLGFLMCICMNMHVCADISMTTHLLLCDTCFKSARMKSHYIRNPTANPSANAVNGHPDKQHPIILLSSGTVTLSFRWCHICGNFPLLFVSLPPSPRRAIEAERLGKLKPHRCATTVARYSLQGDSICLQSPLE